MNKKHSTIDRLQVILEASKLLNSTQDINYILNFLLKKSMEIINNGDTGVIFLYSKEKGVLVPKFYIGFHESIKDIRLLPGESMTGLAFKQQETVFLNKIDTIKKTMSTMRKQNEIIVDKSLRIKSNELKSSICCPLMYRKECIGVIVIDNFDGQSAFTQDDVDFLEAISAQAAVAIINAQNYKKEIENNKELEKYNKLLEDEKNRYQYSTNLHNKFSKMVLNGCSIEDILSDLASMIKRDVFVIDLFYNITSSSLNYFIDIDVIQKQEANINKHLNDHNKTRWFDETKALYYLFYPIIVNLDTLGWICIVSKDYSLPERDNITIEKGTTIIALEHLKLNELNDLEQTLKGDFLDGLLKNQDKDYLKKCSQKYNFDFNDKCQLIILEILKDSSFLSSENCEKIFIRYMKYYYKTIAIKTKHFFSNSIVLIKDQKIIIIFKTDESSNKKNIELFLDELKNNNSVFLNRYEKINFKAGISNIINNLNEFRQSFYNTIQALNMAINSKKNVSYLFYEDLEIKKFLLKNDSTELKDFVDRNLGALINYPKISKNEFIKTLEVYLRSNGNWTYTKDYLHIHGNTLSYRLNKIMHILNVDLNNYNQRLKLQIAFEILDLL